MSGIAIERSNSNLSNSSSISATTTTLTSSNPNQHSQTHINGQPIVQSFPPTHQLFSYGSKSNSNASTSNSTTILSALHNDTSSLHAVSKAVLHISQFSASPPFLSPSSNSTHSTSHVSLDGTNEYTHASLIHIPRYTEFIVNAIQALKACAMGHNNRICRILALKCLPLLARSMFAKCRFSGALASVLHMDEHGVSSSSSGSASVDSGGRNGIGNVTIARVEDECTNEAGFTLAQSAIMEEDEGMSAVAMEGLAILICCCPTGSPSEDVVLDPLMEEVHAILRHGRVGSDNTVTRNLNETHHAMIEFQARIMENVIPSRLRRMVYRFTHFSNFQSKQKALPFFTFALTYFLTHNHSSSNMSHSRFAKRWYEIDYMTLAREMVHHTFIPGMVDSLCKGYSLACALATIRLVDACSKCQNGSIYEVNGPHICQLAANILLENAAEITIGNTNENNGNGGEIEEEMVESKLVFLSCSIISTRVLPLSERPEILLGVLETLCHLTISQPASYNNLGPSRNSNHFSHDKDRYSLRPNLTGLLIEIALNLLTDGISHLSFPEERVETLKFILSDPVVSSILQHKLNEVPTPNEIHEHDTALTRPEGRQQRAFFPDNESESNGDMNGNTWKARNAYLSPHLGEELVFAFCCAALNIGRQLCTSSNGARRQSSLDIEEWLQCSIIILANFSACLDWIPRSNSYHVYGHVRVDDTEAYVTTDGSSLSSLPSSQTMRYILPATESYISLLALCLSKVNLLSSGILSALSFLLPSLDQSSSLSINDSSIHTRKFSKGMSYTPDVPSILASNCSWAKPELSMLCRQLLECKLREGISSLPSRITLLCLLANHWKTCFSYNEDDDSSAYDGSSSSDSILMESCAHEMLSMLHVEVVSLLESSSNLPTLDQGMFQLFLICIRAMEGIALHSLEKGDDDGSKDLGSKSSSGDNSIVALVLEALLEPTKNSEELNSNDKESSDPSSLSKKLTEGPVFRMKEECKLAATRIQSALDNETASSNSGEMLNGNNQNEKRQGLLTPPRQTRISAGDRPTSTIVSSFSQKTPSSHVSAMSPMFAPAILSPLHSLSPFQPVPHKEFLEELYWHQARLMILSRASKALQYSPLGVVNIPKNQPETGSAHSSMMGGIKNSQSTLENDNQKHNFVTRPVIPRNLLRLPSHSRTSASQRIPESMKDVIQTISGSSDPLSITLAYGLRNVSRFDGEHEPHMLITVRITNITPVPILKGLQLELSILRHILEKEDDDFDSQYTSHHENSPVTRNILDSLHISRPEDLSLNEDTNMSTSALFKAVLAPYESLTWEVMLHQWESGSIELSLSTTVREVSADFPTHRWLSCEKIDEEEKHEGETPVHEVDGDDGSDSSQSNNTVETGPLDDEYMEEELLEMKLISIPVYLEASIVLQSCPFVFFSGIPGNSNNANKVKAVPNTGNKIKEDTPVGTQPGDADAFWFLWTNMPRKTIHLIVSRRQRDEVYQSSDKERAIVDSSVWAETMKNSSLWVQDKTMNQNEVCRKRAWAFITWCGSRLLCLESGVKRKTAKNIGSPERTAKNGEVATKRILEIRSEDVKVLLSFVGSRKSRKKFVENLMSGEWECEEKEEAYALDDINDIHQDSLPDHLLSS